MVVEVEFNVVVEAVEDLLFAQRVMVSLTRAGLVASISSAILT